jgi:pimeloyl-ACP methyl ester carboxylesterase
MTTEQIMTGTGADGIILIHGAHHGPWVWDDVVPLLSLPSLAVELPGRGGTASRPGAPGTLTLDDLICSALGDLDRAGWRRAVIVGHSLGGAVAAGLAARAPRRAHHLVLIAASVPGPGRCALDSWPAALRWLPRLALGMRPGGRHAPLTLSARRARRRASGLGDAQARRLLDRLVPDTPGFLTTPMPAAPLPAGLPRSYIVASKDRIHKPRRQAATATRLGAARIEIDTGHDPMLAHPAAVARIINRTARAAADPPAGDAAIPRGAVRQSRGRPAPATLANHQENTS